ncbi:hypothetical protein GF373_07295 [bacterium]|nr:hypothetical protein [bacterium]
MISIGTFIFSKDSTLAHVSNIEAKSRVRKAIRIQSMLRGTTSDRVRRDAEELQSMVESFERGEATLSMNAGRYYDGRRREFHLTPCPDGTLAWVDLLVLTHDRYERSTTLHQQAATSIAGRIPLSLFSIGNWKCPLAIQLQADMDLTALRIESAEGVFSVNQAMPGGTPILINAENRLYKIGEETRQTESDAVFPYLHPGMNAVEIKTEPISAHVEAKTNYRDFWV